jgi:hypothetical protein
MQEEWQVVQTAKEIAGMGFAILHCILLTYEYDNR